MQKYQKISNIFAFTVLLKPIQRFFLLWVGCGASFRVDKLGTCQRTWICLGFGPFPWKSSLFTRSETHEQHNLLDTIFDYIFVGDLQENIYIYIRYIYIYIYIYIYVYIYIYGSRISDGLHPRPLVVGVPGGHYFHLKSNLIDIIESWFSQPVKSKRFNENINFSWV